MCAAFDLCFIWLLGPSPSKPRKITQGKSVDDEEDVYWVSFVTVRREISLKYRSKPFKRLQVTRNPLQTFHYMLSRNTV